MSREGTDGGVLPVGDRDQAKAGRAHSGKSPVRPHASAGTLATGLLGWTRINPKRNARCSSAKRRFKTDAKLLMENDRAQDRRDGDC